MVSLLGIGISMLSFLYGLAVVLAALMRGAAVQGWPTLMATVLFLGGLQLLVSGMIGEYIWRGLDESRGRPLYILADQVGFQNELPTPVGHFLSAVDERPTPVAAG
jgi:dolichol-phosphate mannosyltransferase